MIFRFGILGYDGKQVLLHLLVLCKTTGRTTDLKLKDYACLLSLRHKISQLLNLLGKSRESKFFFATNYVKQTLPILLMLKAFPTIAAAEGALKVLALQGI